VHSLVIKAISLEKAIMDNQEKLHATVERENSTLVMG
jgi:hypothetical protein